MRKLATIRRVDSIREIPGADAIEVAQIGGWDVVTKKGEFKAGDLGIYFEIDSMLPLSNPAFWFLDKKIGPEGYTGTDRYRLKTVRLRKQLSQGLLLPITAFSNISYASVNIREGEDLTEILNIEKYESPSERQDNAPSEKGRSRTKPWPFFLQKTDQERVQNISHTLLSRLEETFEVSVKLDGSSMTVYVLDPSSPYYDEAVELRRKKELSKLSFIGKLVYKAKNFFKAKEPIVGVCSRNIDLAIEEDNNFSNYVRENGVVAKIQKAISAGFLPKSVAFQGELIAPSIQSNYEKVSKPEWYVFDVFNIDSQEYFKPKSAKIMVESVFGRGLGYVPIVSRDFKLWEEGEEKDSRAIVDKLLKIAEGPGMNEGVMREGLVFKSNDSPVSFKCISNSYLEKKG